MKLVNLNLMIRRNNIAFILALASLSTSAVCGAQAIPQSLQEKQQALWQKLESSVGEVDRNLDGAMGVAILDLTACYINHEFGELSGIARAFWALVRHDASMRRVPSRF